MLFGSVWNQVRSHFDYHDNRCVTICLDSFSPFDENVRSMEDKWDEFDGNFSIGGKESRNQEIWL